MKATCYTRIETTERYPVKFAKTVIARLFSRKMTLVDALIYSIKTGAVLKFEGDQKSIQLSVGMLDMHSEPWGRKTPMFYGYQIREDDLKSEEQVKAVWIGELTSLKTQVVLRLLEEPALPAQTRFVGTMHTSMEMRSGFLDGIVGHEGQASFDVMSDAMKCRSLLQVETSRLLFGLGVGRFAYTPYYLPVQLERVYPWMDSEAIWTPLGPETEPRRRLYHSGYAIMNVEKKGEKRWVAHRAAGFFFTSSSEGGYFRQEGGEPRIFADETCDGLRS